MSIEIQNISKSFGAFTALKDISLKIENGELISLLGPSGSGKTTLLRVIAGMESPDPNPNSHVLFFGEDVANKPVGDRKVGFVFQHYALFKHMSVFENIAFGLRVRPRSQRPVESAIRDKVHSLLKLIQLEGFGTRFPKQLSGGQRQRVALARALAIEPQVLLLDEPFGALDAKVRKGLRDWLRGLHDELNTTTILVTHDQEEALEVSDRVVVMNQAKNRTSRCTSGSISPPRVGVCYRFSRKCQCFPRSCQSRPSRLGQPSSSIVRPIDPRWRASQSVCAPKRYHHRSHSTGAFEHGSAGHPYQSRRSSSETFA